MRLHGYCTSCHKFKLVTVKMSAWGRGAPQGTCDQCEEARAKR